MSYNATGIGANTSEISKDTSLLSYSQNEKKIEPKKTSCFKSLKFWTPVLICCLIAVALPLLLPLLTSLSSIGAAQLLAMISSSMALQGGLLLAVNAGFWGVAGMGVGAAVGYCFYSKYDNKVVIEEKIIDESISIKKYSLIEEEEKDNILFVEEKVNHNQQSIDRATSALIKKKKSSTQTTNKKNYITSAVGNAYKITISNLNLPNYGEKINQYFKVADFDEGSIDDDFIKIITDDLSGWAYDFETIKVTVEKIKSNSNANVDNGKKIYSIDKINNNNVNNEKNENEITLNLMQHVKALGNVKIIKDLIKDVKNKKLVASMNEFIKNNYLTRKKIRGDLFDSSEYLKGFDKNNNFQSKILDTFYKKFQSKIVGKFRDEAKKYESFKRFFYFKIIEEMYSDPNRGSSYDMIHFTPLNTFRNKFKKYPVFYGLLGNYHHLDKLNTFISDDKKSCDTFIADEKKGFSSSSQGNMPFIEFFYGQYERRIKEQYIKAAIDINSKDNFIEALKKEKNGASVEKIKMKHIQDINHEKFLVFAQVLKKINQGVYNGNGYNKILETTVDGNIYVAWYNKNFEVVNIQLNGAYKFRDKNDKIGVKIDPQSGVIISVYINGNSIHGKIIPEESFKIITPFFYQTLTHEEVNVFSTQGTEILVGTRNDIPKIVPYFHIKKIGEGIKKHCLRASIECLSLRINYSNTSGQDAGGLARQYLSTIIHALIHEPNDKKKLFFSHNGYFYPSTKNEVITKEEKENFESIGLAFALCFYSKGNNTLRTGKYFNDDLFEILLHFSSKDLLSGIKKIDQNTLLRFHKKLCELKDEKNKLEIIKSLSNRPFKNNDKGINNLFYLFDEEDQKKYFQSGKVENPIFDKIKKGYAEILSKIFPSNRNTLNAIYAIAQGMSQAIGGEWDSFRNNDTAKNVSKNIQGTLDRRLIIKQLKVSDLSTEDKRVTWTKEFIKNCTKEELLLFLGFVTGAKSYATPIRILGEGSGVHPTAHTCFNQFCISSNSSSKKGEYLERLKEAIHNNGSLED